MVAKATEIREARKKSHSGFREKINDLLVLLAMPNARLKVQMKELPGFVATGKDEIQFLFATNKGSDYLPLKDVASGGEMARLTLCLKSVIAAKMELPTMILMKLIQASRRSGFPYGTNHVSDGTITSIDQHYPFSSNCCQGSTPLLCI